MLAEEWGRESCSFVLLSHVFLSFCLIMRGGAHPDPPKGRGPDTHPPLPWRLLRRLLRIKNPDIQLRRICYPPEQKGARYQGATPLPWGKATGSCSCKRTKFERASFARVIDGVASLVEEWGWGWVSPQQLVGELAELFLETLGEVAGSREAHLVGHFTDVLFGGEQHLAGFVQAYLAHQLHWR